jgi:hypothetical protein
MSTGTYRAGEMEDHEDRKHQEDDHEAEDSEQAGAVRSHDGQAWAARPPATTAAELNFPLRVPCRRIIAVRVFERSYPG